MHALEIIASLFSHVSATFVDVVSKWIEFPWQITTQLWRYSGWVNVTVHWVDNGRRIIAQIPNRICKFHGGITNSLIHKCVTTREHNYSMMVKFSHTFQFMYCWSSAMHNPDDKPLELHKHCFQPNTCSTQNTYNTSKNYKPTITFYCIADLPLLCQSKDHGAHTPVSINLWNKFTKHNFVVHTAWLLNITIQIIVYVY